MWTISRKDHSIFCISWCGIPRDYTFGRLERKKVMEMNLDPQWIVGFVDGEGCFFVGINPHRSLKMKAQVLPEFTVVQHKSDIQLLYGLKSYFGCGVVRKDHGDRMAYRVRGYNHLLDNILPFFEKHKLKSKRRIEFERFRTIVLMMAKGNHLTAEGLEKIRAIIATMRLKSNLVNHESNI
jgi:hypothetical protein